MQEVMQELHFARIEKRRLCRPSRRVFAPPKATQVGSSRGTTPWKPEHYPTLSDPRQVGRLLRDIDAYQGGFITKCAMKLSPLLFVRPGELRRAEWSEINLDATECRIPGAKMKGRVMHIVPLAKQAADIARVGGARQRRRGPGPAVARWIS
jgi:integrase